MQEHHWFVYEGGEGRIEEKKSRFIATVCPVRAEEEALERIAALKKQYWDARHNCYAYTIGDRQQLQRFSDDGEPQGTAGRPILEVLKARGIHDVLIVVTRYFGGVLLGTGGLVRAYSAAAKAGLDGSVILDRQIGIPVWIGTDYNDVGKILYLLGQQQISLLESEYTDRVRLRALFPQDLAGSLEDAITEATGGRSTFTQEEPAAYTIRDKEVIRLPDLS